MPATARPSRTRSSRPSPSQATVTRRIDAPVDTVWSLLADVHHWARWGPFIYTPHPDRPGLPHPIRLGRHDLSAMVTSPDAPYWLRYRLTSGPSRALHSAEVTLSPTSDGGTELLWQATVLPALPGIGRRRRAALVTAVTELAARLASAAEDAPSTRAEWADRHGLSVRTTPARSAQELAA